jgi:hypothetical protein
LVAILAAALLCGLVALGIWAALRPYAALMLLLALLIFHSGASYFLSNVLLLDNTLVVLLSAWKEAVIAGLVVAALTRFRRDPPRLQPAFVLAAILIVLIALRVVVDLASHVSPADEILGARDASEFGFVFLAVMVLRPGADWLRRTSWMLVPLVFLAAEAGLVQVLFGFPVSNWLFHAPGEQLASAYSAKFGGIILPRAAGTYVAPNEFGLGLDIYLLAVILPLALIPLNALSRSILAASAALACTALALTYSRSAWVGLAAAVVVIALPLTGRITATVKAHLASPSKRTAILGAIAVAALLLIAGAFVASDGPKFIMTTLTGQEASAAGRPSSLAKGFEELLHYPFGKGVTAAGPKALALNPGAVLTENWYLVYGIQLGWLALAALCALAIATLFGLVRAAVQGARANGAVAGLGPFQIGTLGALVAALVGALFIPALLDLPASLTLWTFVAVGLSTPDRVPATAEVAPRQLEERTVPPTAPARPRPGGADT